MSLQFVMGPSGSGKSHYLYQWVTKESLENPNKKYIVLVPEQFTMQTQKDLVMASPRKGIMNVEVLSFNRLAQRVFDETGENGRTILSEVGKNFVIRKIANSEAENLKVIGSNLRKIGYITEVKSIISEFTQYDIELETLDEIIDKAKEHPSLCYKLNDLRIIYEKFRTQLKEKYITSEEILNVLSMVVNKSKLLKDSVVVLDGFTGFTPIQNKLLGQLMQLCSEVAISVTMDQKENPFVYQNPYQLFALSKQMVTTLVRIAEEHQIEVKRPIYLYDYPVYRFKNNEPMAFLEHYLFRYSNDSYGKKQDTIQIWHAKNPMEEVDFVAQKIRELVRTETCRYQDVAILTSGMDDYASAVERIFTGYDIPFFMDHKRSILLNSCVEFLRSLLVMAEQDFSYDSVFRYLRTEFSNLSPEEVDVLENYVLAYGIRGFKRWNEQWVRKARGMTLEQLEEVNAIRAKFISHIETVMTTLKSKKKTVLEVTGALHSFFLEVELQKRVQMRQLRFEEEGELSLAKEYAQVYRIIIELFEQFVELLGDESISLKEYCELLDAGLEEAKVGVIPPSLDQVVIGDVERSRIKDVKVVFLLGASDKYIPSSGGKKGILSEYDRQVIADGGSALAPNEKEKTYIQKFYLYLMLTKPEKQLYLTFSTSGGDGKAARPSYLVSELCKLFPNLKMREVPNEISEKELTAKRGLNSLIDGLQKKQYGLNEEWQQLYTWYRAREQWKDRVDHILEAAFYKKPDTSITSATAKELYGTVLENSVTRLETYSACAYSHFLSYGLNLQERKKFEFKSIDFGNLFHSAMEKFSTKLENSEWTWTTLPKEQEDAFIEESINESIVDYESSILYSSLRNEYMILRLKRLFKRSIWALRQQLKKGDFIPEGYEVSFGNLSGLKMSNVDLGELGKLRLRGKIDRIDIHREKDRVYVKIVDYKSSVRKLEWSKLCHGLQLQLFVYLNAAMELEKRKSPDKEIIPAGVLYSAAIDPVIDKQKHGENIEGALLDELKPHGFIQSDEQVIRHLDKEMEQKSQVIPVSRNKDGSLRTSNELLTAEEFSLVSDYVEHQVQRIGKEILQGNAQIAPHQIGQETGCMFCEYKDICGIREKAFGHRYREIENMKKDEALEIIRKEVDAWE